MISERGLLSFSLQREAQPFSPIVRNPHLLTVLGNFWPRRLDTVSFPVQERFFQTEPGVEILVHSQRPSSEVRGEVILVHGLEGSSQAGYARSAAQAGLEHGFAVHRYNMRSCGGTEARCGPSLYHSGQTSDLLVVARQLHSESQKPVLLAGFSLGGNVVLKLAGELGSSAKSWIAGAAAVSTPIDLAACVEQLRLPGNRIYAHRFLDRLKKRIVSKEKLHPGLFATEELPNVNSVYDFDDKFTAPSFGFGTADRYYATQSSNQYLEKIRTATLIIQAKDDPLIPFRVYQHPAFQQNPALRLLTPEHGGHLGFVSSGKSRFWLDGILLNWWEECASLFAGNKSTTLSVSS